MSVIQTGEARREIHPASRSLHREKQAVKSRAGDGIDSVGALHVHALAMAQEAIAGYREFAAYAADHCSDELADLFSRLAELKAERVSQLPEAAAGMMSKLARDECAWLASGPPLPAARDFIFRMMTPRQSLEIALRAEQRARAFFEQVLAASKDAGDRELAIEFRRDEDLYIAWLQDTLARVPEPFRPSDDCPGDPAMPQDL